jgi:hypothetical protein
MKNILEVARKQPLFYFWDRSLATAEEFNSKKIWSSEI